VPVAADKMRAGREKIRCKRDEQEALEAGIDNRSSGAAVGSRLVCGGPLASLNRARLPR